MKTIIENVMVSFQDRGEGPVILFLHGWGNDSHSFDLLASEFVFTHRVIQLDFPGFGQSEVPKTAWTISDYAHFVARFIRKLSLEVDIIVGHSFGGRVLIKGVGEQWLTPKKLILIGAAGIAKRKSLRNRTLKVISKIGKTFLLIPPLSLWQHEIRKKFYKKIGSDYFDAGVMQPIYLNTISEDLQQYAKKITVPTQLIWGKHDTATPTQDGKLFSTLISNSKWHVLDDAGHFVHQEKSKEVATLIKDFIS